MKEINNTLWGAFALAVLLSGGVVACDGQEFKGAAAFCEDQNVDLEECSRGSLCCRCQEGDSCGNELICNKESDVGVCIQCTAGRNGCSCEDNDCNEPGQACNDESRCDDCEPGTEGCTPVGSSEGPEGCNDGLAPVEQINGLDRCKPCDRGTLKCNAEPDGSCNAGLRANPDTNRCEECLEGKSGCACDGDAVPGDQCDVNLACNGVLCVPCVPGTDGCTPRSSQGPTACDDGLIPNEQPSGQLRCEPCNAGTHDCTCRPDASCDAGFRCEFTTNRCVDCSAGTADCICRQQSGNECDARLFCEGDLCVSCDLGDEGCTCRATGNPCGNALACDEATNRCERCDPATEFCSCDQGDICNEELECSDGLCLSCERGTLGCSCRVDANDQCNAGGICENGRCQYCPTGDEGCPCLANDVCNDELACLELLAGKRCSACDAGTPNCLCSDDLASGCENLGTKCTAKNLCETCEAGTVACGCDSEVCRDEGSGCNLDTSRCELCEVGSGTLGCTCSSVSNPCDSRYVCTGGYCVKRPGGGGDVEPGFFADACPAATFGEGTPASFAACVGATSPSGLGRDANVESYVQGIYDSSSVCGNQCPLDPDTWFENWMANANQVPAPEGSEPVWFFAVHGLTCLMGCGAADITLLDSWLDTHCPGGAAEVGSRSCLALMPSGDLMRAGESAPAQFETLEQGSACAICSDGVCAESCLSAETKLTAWATALANPSSSAFPASTAGNVPGGSFWRELGVMHAITCNACLTQVAP